jgi:hypothetical protein
VPELAAADRHGARRRRGLITRKCGFGREQQDNTSEDGESGRSHYRHLRGGGERMTGQNNLPPGRQLRSAALIMAWRAQKTSAFYRAPFGQELLSLGSRDKARRDTRES